MCRQSTIHHCSTVIPYRRVYIDLKEVLCLEPSRNTTSNQHLWGITTFKMVQSHNLTEKASCLIISTCVSTSKHRLLVPIISPARVHELNSGPLYAIAVLIPVSTSMRDNCKVSIAWAENPVVYTRALTIEVLNNRRCWENATWNSMSIYPDNEDSCVYTCQYRSCGDGSCDACHLHVIHSELAGKRYLWVISSMIPCKSVSEMSGITVCITDHHRNCHLCGIRTFHHHRKRCIQSFNLPWRTYRAIWNERYSMMIVVRKDQLTTQSC